MMPVAASTLEMKRASAEQQQRITCQMIDKVDYECQWHHAIKVLDDLNLIVLQCSNVHEMLDHMPAGCFTAVVNSFENARQVAQHHYPWVRCAQRVRQQLSFAVSLLCCVCQGSQAPL
jgi:hypothetical protein